MSRRKDKIQLEEVAAYRQARIDKLLVAGWITNAEEIPVDAIPVDPDHINLGGSYFHPTCFQDVYFTCEDCGAFETWRAADQQWYYETTGAPYYVTAIRCRPCRLKEKQRKHTARITAGHAKPNNG